MNRIKIEVPSGIKYISEWTSYTLPSNKHCIIDKGVSGCGYTEFCLKKSLEARIKSKFIPGIRMFRETIKVKLQQIYDSLNLKSCRFE